MRQVSQKKATKAASAEGKADAKYLKAVRKLPCVICELFLLKQNSPTTAHHTIRGRYGARKTPDTEAIPLCDGHHQGTFDTSKIAIHREPAAWRDHYGLDTDYIEHTQAAVIGLGEK